MSFRTGHAAESSSSCSALPCRRFSFSEIELATKNFDESLVIGRGGFGKVYRGTVACGEILLDVAIKQLDSDSSQGAEEFWAEIEMLSNLRHCHLVSLIGYCKDGQEMILVYEYMPNGTLADRIHKSRAPQITWIRRLKICIGAARGLDYLHTSTGIKHGVIHRDVKSSNILLDDNWAAKISDFGLSKIGPTNQPLTYVSTLVKGTFGYLDPDYFQTGRLTRKSDVYAFGVVLLEVLCEKKAVDRSIDEEEWGLATWAQDSIKEGRLKQIVDFKLRERIFPKCLKEFALLADRCLHSRPKQRPTMAEVVACLESILALQVKIENTMPFKLFGRGVQTSRITYNGNSVRGTSLKSLDMYLYNVGGEDRIVHRFNFNTIVHATQNFSDANRLPRDGYRSVYKGRLQNGQDIRITQYSYGRIYDYCMNEALILVKIEHENVIQLLGYCIEGTTVYLLYNFAFNATLAGLIYDPLCNLLDWNKRYKIILGVARILVYLHNHAPIRIIHGDVKPANILLDESFNPKLSGFYGAIAVNEADGIHVDNICGAIRYIAPKPCRRFTLSEIELATQNFDELLVIGRGGFGKVYRGTVTYGEVLLDAAIKRLESDSNQGAVEFWAEVKMLSELRHCHLVSLIGYCNDGQEMILVYEYIPNGTLADRLHKRRAPLTWVRRLKICVGAARGLDYLHTGTGIKRGVIHRDVKSSNILLDDNWTAKISDFGLSKIGPTNQPLTYVSTLVKGTFGYLDPDYFQTGRLTRKSDVYAFGVVLFEVLCGKQAVDSSIDEEHWGLVTWAQDSIEEGKVEQIIDSNLKERTSLKNLKEFALLAGRCVNSCPKQRPTMAEVVVGLKSILASHERTDSQLLQLDIRFFGRRVPTFLFPSKNSVGGTSLKSLDTYLHTIGGEDQIVHRFDFNTIVYATDNFSEANELSSNCYSSVYKGRLQNGQDVTITQYSSTSVYARTYEVCMNEASILVKFGHEHVIELLGYCIDGTRVYLLYDFALNSTLAGLIFDPMCDFLDWNIRYKIILSVARVLVYLHNHAPIRIIHGDVKPAKILLNESFDLKLSGFGLAMTIDETDCIYVDSVHGTPGYVSAEYHMTLCLSTKEDVFSFGVLVLETITGKSNNTFTCVANDEEFVLIEHVWQNWLEGTLANIIDPRVDVDANLMTKFVEIGLLCVQKRAAVRPTMEEVVGMLLGTLSVTLPVSEMRARMIHGEPPPDVRWIICEDSDT